MSEGAPIGIISRIVNFILHPIEVWACLAEEPVSSRKLLWQQTLILASLPPLTKFISDFLYGNFRRPFTGWNWTAVGNDLIFSLFIYALNLLSVRVVGFLLNGAASVFGLGRGPWKFQILAHYCLAPFWVAGIFYLIPKIGWIINTAAGLFSISYLYIGLRGKKINASPGMAFGLLATVLVPFVLFYVGLKQLFFLFFLVWLIH